MDGAFGNLHQEIQGAGRQGNKPLVLLVHVIIWMIFLSLPAVFRPHPPGIGWSVSWFVNDILEPPRWTNALLLIAVFYFNYYFVIPSLYMRKKYVVLGLVVAVCFIVFYVLNDVQMPDEIRQHPSGGFNSLGNSFNLFMFLIVYASSFALCLYEQWQETRDQMLRTQISFLKAQINPHFLFNTLNSIYSLTLLKSDKAPDALMRLSGMMRYAVSEANHTYVSLAKELGYIANYVDLQQLRLAENVKIAYKADGITNNKQIAPFLLIPFVENAFRYGVNSEENSDIRIEITVGEGDLRMLVINNKVYLRPDLERGMGLGIATTRQRLQLIYPGKHTLTVEDSTADFKVLLQITLK